MLISTKKSLLLNQEPSPAAVKRSLKTLKRSIFVSNVKKRLSLVTLLSIVSIVVYTNVAYSQREGIPLFLMSSQNLGGSEDNTKPAPVTASTILTSTSGADQEAASTPLTFNNSIISGSSLLASIDQIAQNIDKSPEPAPQPVVSAPTPVVTPNPKEKPQTIKEKIAPTKPQVKVDSEPLPSTSGYFSYPTTGKNHGVIHSNNGVDISNSCGTPVYASADGVVNTSQDGWNGGYGNYVKISHPNSTETLYAHFATRLVSVGQQITKGQLVGLMGTTGHSTGCHLHFEVHGGRNPLAR